MVETKRENRAKEKTKVKNTPMQQSNLLKMDTEPSFKFVFFNLSRTQERVRWVVIGIIIGTT